MRIINTIHIVFCISFLISCNTDKKEVKKVEIIHDTPVEIANTEQCDSVIIDCNYTFAEAIEGTNAPQIIIDQLELIVVRYYSTDGKIHQGQILANREITEDIKHIFKFMLTEKFPVAQVIPIVKYEWNDNLSMQANNTYSFCYRNIHYSKHAHGLAIDINPYFNPLRFKKEERPNRPEGAVYNPTVPGTFHPEHPVVLEFERLGYRWGHCFNRYYDDHHFELYKLSN